MADEENMFYCSISEPSSCLIVDVSCKAGGECMKVLQINIFGNLSTGKIAVGLYRGLKENGHDGIVAFARNEIPEDVPNIRIGNKWSVRADGAMSRLTDRAGFYSKHATRKLIQQIKEYNPDVIHLHNLHGYYINVEMLFEYLKESRKPVVWTLHDCWAFTGHCCYYSMACCEKWKTGCSQCSQTSAYPKSLFFDNSEWNYQRKRELFTSLPNLRLVCVSKWLEGEVKQSFLKEIPCKVIYNGIDLNVFKPVHSDIRLKYGLNGKKIILGVASTWDVRKGLKDFISLATMLDDEYRIVLVGLTKKQKNGLPANIIGLGRTKTAQELVEMYSMADLFFNASIEETFGLPTVEAIACGTPVIVYDATALPEVVTPQTGRIVPKHDLQAVKGAIEDLLSYKSKVLPKEVEGYSNSIMQEQYMNTYIECIRG